MENKLAMKLIEVVKAIPVVGKRGKNTFHNYSYAMEVDFLEAVRPLLVDRNILMTMSITSIDIQAMEKEGKLTTIRTLHTFTDAETGESLSFEGAGQGTDKGDKGIYKAQTGALKYALAKNFLISTGDDPESFADKRMEAGRKSKAAPVAQKPDMTPGNNSDGSRAPANPWIGKLKWLSDPIPWINPVTQLKSNYWEMETDQEGFNLTTFDSGIFDCAKTAIFENAKVQIQWKLGKSKKTGKEYKTVEGMAIIES